MGFYLATVRNSEFLVGWTGRNVYTSGNRPSWWPKDVAFASMTGIIYSDKYTDLCRVCGLHDNYRIVTIRVLILAIL